MIQETIFTVHGELSYNEEYLLQQTFVELSNKLGVPISISQAAYTENRIYKAIKSELDYQNEMTNRSDRPDMIENMHLGDILLAINYNFNLAQAAWYKGSTPHPDTMNYLRKIAALCVKAGMLYEMPERK